MTSIYTVFSCAPTIMSGSLGSQHNSPQDSHVSSSNIVEIKKLRSILKSATKQLELCSIAYESARRELGKCKKILKPRTCPCSHTCTCKPCNDINVSLRQLESRIHDANLDHHVKFIESSVDLVIVAYKSYKSAHAQDWDI